MAHSQDGILLHSGTNEVEFMEFYLAGRSYGVNISKVVRVVSLKETPVTALPEAPPGIAGAIYDQDKPLKLINLRFALGVTGPETDPSRQLVLVARFNQTTTAYIIDGIQKIHRTSWERFQPLEATFGASPYLSGTVQMDDRIVLILDFERLLLDFTTPVEAAEEVAPEESIRDARARLHIVYAEDSAVVRRHTTNVLHNAGFTNLEVFDNGQTALEFLLKRREDCARAGRDLREDIQLVLTDIEMPRLDGLTLCRRIKESGGAGIPAVVVYSSLINDEMKRKCKSVGTDRELSKPHGNDIIDVIDELCLATPAGAAH